MTNIITQKDADKIQKIIKDDLNKKFGNIIDIDVQKAKDIANYCHQKQLTYDPHKNVIEYYYYYKLYRDYQKAYDVAQEITNKK